MQYKEKVAIFDFCETLANFQTADAYVEYIRERFGNKSMKNKERFRVFLRKTKVMAIANVLFPKGSMNKRLVLWQLKGFSKSELEQYARLYYERKIKPNLIVKIIDELKQLQLLNWRIVIASAGYEIYLKYFCDDFCIPLQDLIAVKIKFKNDICMGSFDGGDRLWDKTDKLESLLDRKSVVIRAYSDSISDLPLLSWADEAYAVRRIDRQEWSKKYNFKEIVWQI